MAGGPKPLFRTPPPFGGSSVHAILAACRPPPLRRIGSFYPKCLVLFSFRANPFAMMEDRKGQTFANVCAPAFLLFMLQHSLNRGDQRLDFQAPSAHHPSRSEKNQTLQRGRFRTARAQRAHSASYYGVYPGTSPENLPPLEACTSNSKLRNSNVSCSQNYPMSKTMQCRQ